VLFFLFAAGLCRALGGRDRRGRELATDVVGRMGAAWTGTRGRCAPLPTSAPNLGSPPATSALGLAGIGLTPTHICTKTGLIPSHIQTETGLAPCHIGPQRIAPGFAVPCWLASLADLRRLTHCAPTEAQRARRRGEKATEAPAGPAAARRFAPGVVVCGALNGGGLCCAMDAFYVLHVA
jgi:hypothetical protein